MRRAFWAVFGAFLVSCASVGTAWAVPYTVKYIDVPGSTESNATDINDRGQVIVVGLDANHMERSYIWDGGLNMRDIGTIANGGCVAKAINESGTVVGQFTDAQGRGQGFVWNPDTNVMTPLTPVLGSVRCQATDINDAGVICGESEDHPTCWDTTGGHVIVSSPGYTPYGINNSGQIAVGRWLWNPDNTVTELGSLGYGYTRSFEVNDNGQVVGSAHNESYYAHAFIWTKGTDMIDLGKLYSGYGSFAYGINNSGMVVGEGWRLGNDFQHAVLWSSPTTVQDLHPEGAIMSRALAINGAGQIVGQIWDSTGHHAALWTPVPEPSGVLALLSGIALTGSGLLRRRTRG